MNHADGEATPTAAPRPDLPASADTDRTITTRLAEHPRRGDVVAGRYEVIETLAVGGEAAALLARDRELDLRVVLKTRRFHDDRDLELLRREAGLLMRVVSHPGVPVVRSDAVDGDRYYMISDHVDGRDLHDIVLAQTDDGLALPTVLAVIDQVAAALDHLHDHHPPIVHGDVKPENVVVTAQGRAVLVDFGAAMRVGDDRERIGTPGFSAPEVLAGESVEPGSDIFSLAALTVYLLTGLVPRPGTAWPDAMVGNSLARLERVIRQGLTWDPLGRPWRASDFATSLRTAAEDDLPTGTVTLVAVESAEGAGRPSPAQLSPLEAAGGHEATSVRLPPDFSLFVFTRATDAAHAALDLAEGSGLRATLHAGDLGGRRGATLQQLANDLIELAQAHQLPLVCSQPARMLLGSAAGIEVRTTGDGLAELRRPVRPAPEERTTELGVSQLDPEPGRRWITSRQSSTLAGRDQPLAEAQRAIDRQRASASAASVVVRGDAGMGKTRFLAELAARADAAGELVLVGRCSESGGAFESFLDALGDELFPFEQGQLERDEEGWVDRRRFFGRIVSSLNGQGRAVTLVLDDVQWIDGSSLALLAQLLDDVGPSLAVIAGCRPNAAPEVLDQLLVRPGATSMTMTPIDAASFSDMAAAAGVELDADRLASAHALTAGSPFFAVQLLDHLRRAESDGLDDEAASGVRDWILQRADRLGDDVATTLASAATIGREFDVMVLADVLGASPLDVVERLDRALDAGLVVDGAHAGQFGFVHAIVRTTLAERLSGTRRGLLHAAIARRLEEAGDELEQLEPALHHWLAADRLGDPLHTGELAARVGTITTERLAHERAVAILDRALEVVGAASGSRARDRVEAQVRVALGRALFVATRSREALEQLRSAADLAEQADDPETLAHAALVASLNRRHGRDDAELLDLLERASENCPEDPPVLSAMLHIRRSRLLPLSVPHEQRADMARRGLAHIDRMDTVDRAMVETEIARACWEPGDAEQRVAVTTSVIEQATAAVERIGPSRWTGVLIEALNLRWAALAQLGRLGEALGDATTAVEVADQAGTTFLLSRSMMGEAMLRSAIGELELAEQRSAEALAISDRHNLVLVSMAIAYCIGRDRGTQEQLAQLEGQLGDLVDSNAMFVAAFALVHAEAGNDDDARRLLDDLDRRAPWPTNWLWLATVTAALESAVLVHDAARAERYAEMLRPFSGQWAIAAAELGCWGPIDRVLGLAATSAGDHDTARRLLLSARDSSLANGATFWVARCHAGLAALADSDDSSS